MAHNIEELYRLTVIAVLLWRRIHTTKFSYPIKEVRERHLERGASILECFLDKDKVVGKGNRYPHDHLDETHRDAIAVWRTCEISVMCMWDIVHKLLSPYIVPAASVWIEVENPKIKRGITYAGKPYERTKHSVIRVMLRNGEYWVIDITGAQFGLKAWFIPWTTYLRENMETDKWSSFSAQTARSPLPAAMPESLLYEAIRSMIKKEVEEWMERLRSVGKDISWIAGCDDEDVVEELDGLFALVGEKVEVLAEEYRLQHAGS